MIGDAASVWDANFWAQWGLPGMIILAFLVGWAYLGKYFIDKWKKSDDEKHTLLMGVMDEAKNDRTRFTTTILEIHSSSIDAINNNTRAIIELRNELKK